jgi:hypothetical protein
MIGGSTLVLEGWGVPEIAAPKAGGWVPVILGTPWPEGDCTA